MNNPRRKLLYLVTEDWYFWSHRLPMARAALGAGFEVYVATRCDRHADLIRQAGFHPIPLTWRRGAFSPLAAIGEIRQIVEVYARTRPDIVHHVALKPVVFGSMAAALTRTSLVVNALTGLGFTFHSDSVGARAIRNTLRPALRYLLRRPGSLLIVQNKDNAQTLVDSGLVPAESIRIIRGSGVDTHHFQPLKEPNGMFTIGYVGRMLDDKGVRTLVAAHELLRERGVEVGLVLAGDTDPTNPTAIPEAELVRWSQRPGVEWLGHVPDVRQVWSRCHVAVLMSKHEGLPLTLLEAAACGRAMVATDVPGCREVAIDGLNAIRVPVDDPVALAEAVERLGQDAALRHRFAQAGRALVEEEFSAPRVAERILTVYEELLSRLD